MCDSLDHLALLPLLLELLQQLDLLLSSLMSKVEVWTSTSSLLHISLASSTKLSRIFWPSLELVSMKIALYSLAIFSPSSAPTHLKRLMEIYCDLVKDNFTFSPPPADPVSDQLCFHTK